MYKLYNYFSHIETYLLRRAARPRLAARIPVPITHTLSWFDGPRRSGHPDPDFRVEPVNTAGMVQPLDQPQQRPLPRVPRQEPVDQPVARPHELARHPEECLARGRELHPQQPSPLRHVFGPVTRGDGD